MQKKTVQLVAKAMLLLASASAVGAVPALPGKNHPVLLPRSDAGGSGTDGVICRMQKKTALLVAKAMLLLASASVIDPFQHPSSDAGGSGTAGTGQSDGGVSGN